MRTIAQCLIVTLLSAAVLSADQASDMTLMKSRLYGHFLEEGAPDQATIQSYLSTQFGDGSWPDINYSDRSRNVWDPVNHLYRVENMAKAYRTVGHYYYNNGSLFNGCSTGLNYWYSRDPQSDNWWWNEIGVQLTLRKPLILLESLLTSGQISSGCSILNRADTGQTGQNLVWAAESHVVKGLLQMDASTMSSNLSLISGTIVITTSEGVQPDYSFQQHGETLYSGGYGAGFSHDCGFWINVTRATSFGFAQSKVDITANHLLDGQRWMTRGRMFDPGVHGRGISRKDYCTAWEIVSPCQWLMADGVGTGRDSELLALYNQIAQITPANQPAVTGNKHFWHSDYMTHSRPGYFMSTRMYSNRNYNTDGNSDGSPVNGEGKRSHHVADGCTFIFLDGEEYFNIFGVWDWYRVPGTTVEYGTALDPNHVCYKSSKSWVGGVSDGTYGMAAMDHAVGSLSAKKTWFYFDNEVVCLGAGINCNTANSVLTSMNQCLLSGAVRVRDSQGIRTVASGDWTLNTARWAHHDNTGYVFPTTPTTRLRNQAQSNTWNYINDLYSASEIDTRDVFTLWLDHGSYVSGGSYQYVVVPNIAQSQIDAYSQALPVSVRSLTASIQAVEHTTLGILQAAFFAAGSASGTDGLSITVDQPCLVMSRRLPGQMEVSVSNPTCAALNVNVDINRQLSGEGATWIPASGITRIAFSLPSGNDGGKSMVRILDEGESAQFIASTIPDSMAAGQTVQVSVTMKNTGTTAWTRSAGYSLGAVGDSDPFAAGRQQLPADLTVNPGEQYTFVFNMTAPQTAGTYLTDWQMVHEGVRWFGDICAKNVSVSAVQAPYHGTPFAIPCRIQAEDYDLGGEGLAYHDTTTGNAGGQYRSDDVDIETTADTGGGYNIGWTVAGEYLEYTVNVTTHGVYDIDSRVAAHPSYCTSINFHVEMNGVNVTGPQSTGPTTGWQDWKTVTVPRVELTPGQQVLRLALDSSNWNLNWLELRLAAPIVPSDFDHDGDVDQSDFGFLQACYTALVQPVAPGCEPADLNGSTTIDLVDFDEFQMCMGGVNQPPTCSP